MALTDLIEEDSSNRKKDPSDKEGAINSSIGEKPVVGDSHPREDVEYGVEEKACPRCACRSSAESHRTWECHYPECGTVYFTMSWNEWRSGNQFLSRVEVEGWVYNE